MSAERCRSADFLPDNFVRRLVGHEPAIGAPNPASARFRT
jgi:hypothetical protein